MNTTSKIRFTGNLLRLGSVLLLAKADILMAAPLIRDVSVSLTASPDPVVVNGQLTYTLEVRNVGQKPAKSITVKDILPNNTRLLSLSPGCKAAKYRQTKKLICTLKRLDPGVYSSWAIVVVPTADGPITNGVTVTSATGDRNKANNTSTVTTQALLRLNQQPVASPLSLTTDPSIRNITQQLIATDADHDTLTFELLNPASGTGYTQASLNPQSGVLTVALADGFSGTLVFQFRATDGQVFSNTAEVTVSVPEIPQEKHGLGLEAIDPEVYAGFLKSTLSGALLGAPGGAPSMPPSVDLTANFPTPGNQGFMGSCVGWATAYALKSYQESREMGWPLNTPAHQFSPSYIWNQLNGGQNQGTQIFHAFQLMADQGVSTLATMPYPAIHLPPYPQDYQTQPNSTARSEAAQFKAGAFSTPPGKNGIKAALANRQPVVAGIIACDQLQNLQGNNPVYNSLAGDCGGHAVTIVGYDDNRYGGAFKIMNSWGTSHGDGGYFWFPYNFMNQAMTQAYTLQDLPNTIQPPAPPPPPSNPLPNLEVKTWSASYDASPGGSGSLQYEVINSGTATAAAGWYVNLMISKNQSITPDDTYVVYETIPGETRPGGGWHRDDQNPISFKFPDSLTPGTYYMALWLDDLNSVTESKEDDNVSFGSHTVDIANALPDLQVNTWSANWSNSSGDGTLTYEILNSGGTDAQPGWDINLVLSPNQVIGDNDEWFLYYYTTTTALPPGYVTYRDESNPASFNLFVSMLSGKTIPAGTYYMALWVDDTNKLSEANESNNYSLGDNLITINNSFAPMRGEEANTGQMKPQVFGDPPNGTDATGRAYNGRKLPSGKVLAIQKVRIDKTLAGALKMEVIGDTEEPGIKAEEQHVFSKTIRSQDEAVFPMRESTPMPRKDEGTK